MMNKHILSPSSGFCTKFVGSTTSFWAQNTTKIALKASLFAYLLQHQLSVFYLTSPAPGSHVVINNDEGDHLQVIFSMSTPFWYL